MADTAMDTALRDLVDPTGRGEMSYGAPWERGVGVANLMPQRDMEVPVPDLFLMSVVSGLT